MFIYLNKKGQSTLEYGVVIAVIVAALLAMQVYLKRGVQGRLRGASDDIGEQFSPGNTTSEYTATVTSSSNEKRKGGTPTDEQTGRTEATSSQTQTRVGSETVDIFDKEYWKK